MPTVYIINKGGHDYQDASRFGRVEYLSEGSYSPFAVDKMYREFSLKLRESSPDDYLLITGLTVMACIACSCFSFLHSGKLNLLLYRNSKYIERKLLLGKLLTTSEQGEE